MMMIYINELTEVRNSMALENSINKSENQSSTLMNLASSKRDGMPNSPVHKDSTLKQINCIKKRINNL